jgi:TonB-linked SusC/RagA family outer membrane protein
MCVCSLALFAQGAPRSVSGTVTDNTGDPLSGASVKVKNTPLGTMTDIDGRFTLSVSPNAILIVSYIGYATQEIPVNNRASLDIILNEDAQALNEVVVVGYGTQKKVNLTGSVASVSGDDLAKRPVSNPATMLQGQIAGLSIVQGTGQPGNESVTMRIRGQGTYSDAGSDPLVLIDGVPGNIRNLNANDIENVSVLKDASSAAIYGARAANGVILITTKSGTENNFSIVYNLNLGIHSPVNMVKLVTNSADYMRLFNEARTNSGVANSSNTYTDEMIALYENATDRLKYPNFDWFDYAINPALVQNHDLSLSGGVKGTTYNISLGYIDQPGVMMGYGFNKYNFRSNIKSKLKEWVTVGTNLFFEIGRAHV